MLTHPHRASRKSQQKPAEYQDATIDYKTRTLNLPRIVNILEQLANSGERPEKYERQPQNDDRMIRLHP